MFSYRLDDVGSGRLRQGFERDGVAVVKDVIDPAHVTQLREAMRHLIVARLASLNRPASGDDLDELYQLLATAGSAHVGELFAIARQLVEYTALMFAPPLLHVARELVGAPILQVIPESCAIRIDPGNDATRSFGWHHDYSFLAMSQSGITGWIPLVPLTPDMGYLRVVPGSHTTITPVIFHADRARAGTFTGHRAYELQVDAAEVERRSVEIDDVTPADVLFIHCLLLHRSGHNTSARARWTCLPRYGDALDERVVERGWKAIHGRSAPRLFNELHPELVDVREGGPALISALPVS